MLAIETIRQDYCSIKTAAIDLEKEGKISESLELVIAAARIGYEYNFLPSFSDEDLDHLLDKISKNYFPDQLSFESVDNRIVFYDYFAYNNRGLTQQYLASLMELNYEILYVCENDSTLISSNEIFKSVKNYRNAQLLVLSNKLSNKEKAGKILVAISNFKPQKAFLHLAPWDVVGSLVFTRVEGLVHRYFINLTDHAFWLGKNLIDTNIEFRNFGFQLSHICRKIPSHKLKLLPYYPIQADETFLGMPIKTEGKIVGISGGSGYKFLGEQGTFYSLVKDLLEKHKDFCFLLVGAQIASSYFNEQIQRDGLQERFVLIEDRPDIFQLLKRSDIYFASYPFAGGLMIQLAVMAGLPVLSFTKAEYKFNYIEDLFVETNLAFKTHTNEKEFLEKASEIIVDKNIRTKFRNIGEKGIISKNEFTNNLSHVLNNEPTIYEKAIYKVEGIDSTSLQMSNLFIEIENKFSPKYYSLIGALIRKDLLEIIPFNSDTKSVIVRRRERFVLKRSLKRAIKLGIFFLFKFPFIKPVINWVKRKNHGELKFKNGVLVSTIAMPHRILNPHYISVGKDFFSLSNLRIEAWDEYQGERFHPEIVIGDNVVFNSDCHIGCINKVVIGNNVLFASRIYISDHSHGEINKEAIKIPPNQRSLFSKGPVIIGDNVWVGEGVCILPGVTIGANSIIGANAVVTKTVPPNSVVAGIPARIINQF